MSRTLTEVDSCEVCGASEPRPVLNLGNHPMCDDLVPIGDTRICREYPIEILFCEHCVTAHQHFQIPKHELFPLSYHYRSRHTADVLSGMSELVSACEHVMGNLEGKTILDVGCNDGSLLTFFTQRGASTFGIEPTGAAEDAANSGHTVINDFLSTDVAERFVADYGSPDLITFTNVFAHIEDLRSVIRALRTLLARHTRLVIENHYLGSVVAANQFDTFYHEHPRTYSYTSFTYIANSLGLHVAHVEFPRRYGGNIRVTMSARESGKSLDRLDVLHDKERSFGSDLTRLPSRIDHWRNKKLAQIRAELDQYGKLSGKAFPGRAAILIKLLGLDETSISAVFEKPASGKIGHYVPGTRIPILSDDEFEECEGPVLNLAWHISGEIKAYLRERGYNGRIIDIVSQDDFQTAEPN